MKFKECENTFICQLNKPVDRARLEMYRNTKDKSGKQLANYYRDIVKMLAYTPAWGVSWVNKMMNELKVNIYAMKNKEKTGKTSAYAHAGKMLNMVDHFKDLECEAKYNGRYKLQPLLTEQELKELEEL